VRKLTDEKLNYNEYLNYYKELLFGTKFNSRKNKNQVRLFYYRLILRDFFHFVYAILVSLPYLLRIIINATRDMSFGIFSDYIGLNFYIIDRMRHMKRNGKMEFK